MDDAESGAPVVEIENVYHRIEVSTITCKRLYCGKLYGALHWYKIKYNTPQNVSTGHKNCGFINSCSGHWSTRIIGSQA